MNSITRMDEMCMVLDYYGVVDALIQEDLTALDIYERVASLGYRVAPELVEEWLEREVAYRG